MARLTEAQYRNVVRDLFGVTLEERELETDTRPYNFSVIGASSSSVSERGVGFSSDRSGDFELYLARR